MISVSITYPSVSERPPLWRIKHDKENGDLWRVLLPQVHPLFPNQFCAFDKPWQLRSWEMNSKISGKRWTAVYGWKAWGANRNGFGNPDDPRANFVLNEDTDKELPRVELLDTGGNILTGHQEGDWFVADVLNSMAEPPQVDWMFAHPWFINWVTVCGLNGNPIPLLQAQDSAGTVVPYAHPLIANTYRNTKNVFPMYKLQKWDAMELPDPYKVYL